MKQAQTPVNLEKEEKEKSSWRMYDTDFNSKDKRERKSFSNNKLNSSQPLNNRLSRLNNNYSTEKTNSINALGKAGNNIIANMMNKPPHLKISSQHQDNIIHLRMPVNLQNKFTNQTTKSVFNLNFKDSIVNNNHNIKVISLDNPSKVISSPSNSNKGEEEKCPVSISIDSDCIINHLNMVEIWVDTDLAIDNKSLFSTILNKYLKEFTNEVMIKNIDMFNLAVINKTYIKIIKLSLISLVTAKFVLTEFSSYDSSLRLQLKKIFMTISELYGILGDIFLFDLLNSKIVDNKFGLIEKLKKMIKIPYANLLKNKAKNVSNVNEILLQLNKVIDSNLLTQIKSFAQSYFNYGFYQPIFNVLSELIKEFDKFSLQKLITIITECVLFYFVKREVTLVSKKGLPKQNQIDRFIHPYYYPNIQIPFLPLMTEKSKQYTLVLDLDETLVHFFYTPSGGTFFIRPHLFEFLLTLSQMFEIVIFTASMKEYADNILNLIDPLNTLISHRLYRQHTSINEYGVCKDLSKLGRNLSKTIIVDNLVDNFKAQPNNGLWIKTWTDDMNDTELIDLMKILKDIYMLKSEDVRSLIKKINEIVFKNGYSRSGIYFDIDIFKI